jgi:aminopeptidase N
LRKNTEFAIKYIPKVYAYFEEFFNKSEVVTKSDHFASPDFSAGAMENWGLERESILLVDKDQPLLEDEYTALLVIAHEVSHSVKINKR